MKDGEKKEGKELKERRQERKIKDRLGERCMCVGGSWELMVVSRALVQAWTRDKDEEMRLR